jgi:hypothetical protein
MGLEVSKNVNNPKELVDLVNSCFTRNKDWLEYHAETLAGSISVEQINSNALDYANVERRAFQLWRDGYFEKAIAKLEEYSLSVKAFDPQSKGWLLQFAARIALYWGKNNKMQELQQHAYANNRNLLRPRIVPPYVRLVQAGRSHSKGN